VDIEAEEYSDADDFEENAAKENEARETNETGNKSGTRESSPQPVDASKSDYSHPSYEQMETVLNQGMSFLNSLSVMATGKPLAEEENEKSVDINRETGEVVMRFKLPGF